MDFDSYRKTYFIDPAPDPRFSFADSFGVTIYFESFEAAIAYYEQVLGPPGYVEGEGTRGWRIGTGWPIRSCPVVDPFGTEIMILSPLPFRGD